MSKGRPARDGRGVAHRAEAEELNGRWERAIEHQEVRVERCMFSDWECGGKVTEESSLHAVKAISVIAQISARPSCRAARCIHSLQSVAESLQVCCRPVAGLSPTVRCRYVAGLI